MDRYGRKYAVVPSFFIQAMAMALLPFVWNATTLAVAASLIGLGNGLSSGSMMTIGADLSPANARGEFLGIWRLIGDTGFMVGPLIVGGVAGALVLSASAWAVAGAGVMASVIFGLWVPETLQKTAVVVTD